MDKSEMKKQNKYESETSNSHDKELSETTRMTYSLRENENKDFDLNENNQIFEQIQMEHTEEDLRTIICKAFEKVPFQGFHQSKEREIYELPRHSKEESLSRTGSPENNFDFEPLLDSRPLYHQKSERNYPRSSARLTMMSHLIRHIALASQGKKLQDLETEQSIMQNLSFMKFIKEHQPFEKGADRDLLRNPKIFKYEWLLKYVVRSKNLQNDKRLEKKLQKILSFCQGNLEPSEFSSFYTQFRVLLYQKTYELSDSEEWQISEKCDLTEEKLKKIIEICRKLHKRMKEKMKLMNTIGFYYIKKQLEELNHLVHSNQEPSTYQEEAISYFSKRVFEAIRDSVHNYNRKLKTRLFEHTEYFKKVKAAIKIKPFNPWAIWTSLLVLFNAYTRAVRYSLIEKMSLCYDDETKEFLNKLFEHPASFLMSKEILNVDWNLLHKLISNYEEYTKNWECTPESQNELDSNKNLFEMEIFSANVSIQFEGIKNQETSRFIISKPIEWNQNNESELFDLILDQNLANDLCSSIYQEITTQIHEFVDETSESEASESEASESEKMRITKICKIELDFYSPSENLQLYNNLKNNLKMRITEYSSFLKDRGQKYLEFNTEVKWRFFFTWKELCDDDDKDDDYDDDKEVSNFSQEAELGGEKVSLFSYYCLRELLLENPMPCFTKSNFYFLKANNQKFVEEFDFNSESTNKLSDPLDSHPSGNVKFHLICESPTDCLQVVYKKGIAGFTSGQQSDLQWSYSGVQMTSSNSFNKS